MKAAISATYSEHSEEEVKERFFSSVSLQLVAASAAVWFTYAQKTSLTRGQVVLLAQVHLLVSGWIIKLICTV